MSASTEMPVYRSHKEVWALKIRGFEFETRTITPEDKGYAPFSVEQEWVDRNAMKQDVAGGYYVVYEDGYKSWSPAQAFEKGYTQVRGPVNPHMPGAVRPPRLNASQQKLEDMIMAVRYAATFADVFIAKGESLHAVMERARQELPVDSPVFGNVSHFAFDYTPNQRGMASTLIADFAIHGPT
jgi:hypothetical protein